MSRSGSVPARFRGLARIASLIATAAVAVLATTAGAARAETIALPGAAEYARWPVVTGLRVSPSNDRAALLVQAPNGRLALATIDLTTTGAAPKVIAAYADVDIVSVEWVSDKRLVYSAQQPGARIDYDKWGTFAIDPDGTEERQLVSARSDNEAPTGSQIRVKVLNREWRYWRPVRDGSDDVYVERWRETAKQGFQPIAVSRLDTRTGRVQSVTDGQPEGANSWLFDGKDRLAVVTTDDGVRGSMWWKPDAETAWKMVREWTRYGEGALTPLALERDGTLIVGARHGRDATALHTFDLAKNKLDEEPLVAVAGYDVDGVRFDLARHQMIGVSIDAQQPTSVWFDEGLARAQAVVDKALPGRSNVLQCGSCIGAQRFVVHSSSDRQPGEYYVYDAAGRRLVPLSPTRPWITESSQGRRTYHRIAARDGLSLPVVVTHPNGVAADAPAPTVLLVHGGPWAPGSMLTWEAEPQYLASLGYRVLQVSFRGTTGLGWKHFRAAWGQYGLTMEDDLEDALQWAVTQKLTDPDRVCIYGASYGGYAALMGPVRFPKRFRCAVSLVGVTDLSLLFSWTWTDIAASARAYDLKLLIGDPVADAEKLRHQSPVNRVAEIKVPVLMAVGRLDERVAPEHADRFVSAARAAGVDVERVDYEEAHGFSRPETETDFWQRLAAFLAKNLRKP